MASGVALRFLMSSSTSSSLHQGASAMWPRPRAAMNSSQVCTSSMQSVKSWAALASMSAWICSSRVGTAVVRSAHDTVDLAPVSRRHSTTHCPSRSRGPTSSLMGTPLSSQKLYFQPGEWWSSRSVSTRTPTSPRALHSCLTLFWRARRSSVDSLELGMLIPTTCTGATRGGITMPLSSPWIMMATPMERVVKPHEFCHTYALPPSGASTWMLNILLKFCPSMWLVPPWIPRPVEGTKASTVVVKSAPANFSFSLFTPLQTGTASCSS
mmetsp:Transcript_18116/g.54549  ORF Transcript_18116/g.54549 Transcript_18116/m.54549 type:complete len:268 (+) Transcript_18116:5131-5934(+)